MNPSVKSKDSQPATLQVKETQKFKDNIQNNKKNAKNSFQQAQNNQTPLAASPFKANLNQKQAGKFSGFEKTPIRANNTKSFNNSTDKACRPTVPSYFNPTNPITRPIGFMMVRDGEVLGDEISRKVILLASKTDDVPIIKFGYSMMNFHPSQDDIPIPEMACETTCIKKAKKPYRENRNAKTNTSYSSRGSLPTAPSDNDV